MDRDEQHLLVLIETMQRQGRPEHEIETAVMQASGRAKRATAPTTRHLLRFGFPRRARRLASSSN